ncbi:phosphatidylinositol 5-phosphate 4-kinase type-2 alpha-like [Symsagittifera roscoffensis]|uniref:phosphatidylinositol 5-phosphate 4-kinase type-2 alpha-like n=1 Tax=Symsagittifera roscoffensis TaxID=84072 RepID=UPI00307C72D4
MDIESKQRKNKKDLKQKTLKSNDPYLNILMWATKFVVQELSSVPPPLMLMKKDFLANTKVKMQSHGYNKNLPKTFKFKHYSPMVFRSLRETFGVSDDDFLRSVCDAAPTNLSHRRGDLKFYVTHDHKYIIKTMTSEDVAQVHEILERYYRFVVERKGDTLLPQYLDLFRITIDKPPGVYMIIVRNIFSARLPIHHKFNLKGSEKNRKMSEKDAAKVKSGSIADATGAAASVSPAAAAASAGLDPLDTTDPLLHPSTSSSFRDMDFIRQKEHLFIGEESKTKFMNKLTSDIQFLKDCNLMDYSLLLGIHNCQSAKQGDLGIDQHALTDDTFLPDDMASSQPHGGSPTNEQFELESSFNRSGGLDREPLQAGDPPVAHTQQLLSTSPSAGNPDLLPTLSGGEETNDEVEGVCIDGEMLAGAVKECSITGSIPSLGELDMKEDVYAILSNGNKENREIYYIGLIDCLTHWGTRRKMASTAKTVAKPTRQTTTANPDDYGERLVHFMDTVIH